MASVWKGHLTFGLVSFPVRLFTAARSETISFNQLHKTDHSRIKQVIFCQTEDKPIPRSEIVKCYEYEKDHYVVIEDEDIKKVAPKTAKAMEILEFVKEQDVDPVYLESSYYMGPDEGGEKPYALLFEALKETKYCGVAKIAMHNREHIVVVRPGSTGMILHTMYFADEVRKQDEYRTETSAIDEKHLKLAKMLIDTLASDFEPQKYHDTYRENLRTMIQAKVDGHRIVETPAAHTTNVVDIMEALKKSLEQKKKPVGTAQTASSETEPAGQPAPVKKRSGQRRASGA
jgi:DNA end-binding protein Ku